ncbi:hypothetical protein GIB67_004370 [Kingdonia uniflora]|uniref:Uncharacterized protein n=1 Tax=Kingdonia uniflora TaxID=39325 RepID=A0A7J7MRL4_9MAGN|nr:hypothetical protein GIB67_004370 [Kingdonia uniflora]
MTSDSTCLSYWLNWRVLLCAIWVGLPMVFASFLLWRYEGSKKLKSDEEETQTQQERRSDVLYLDEAWRPCLKGIHPVWLLVFRVIAFFALLGSLSIDVFKYGGSVFYYYTQLKTVSYGPFEDTRIRWTFALVTIYFGIGSVISFYGCYQYCNLVGDDRVGIDTDRGTYVAPTYEEHGNVCNTGKNLVDQEQHYDRQTAGICGYTFQAIFQLNAGAVILTDSVFWLIIYPFLTSNDYDLSTLKIITHSVNAIFLIGDTVLNSLRFPLFRFAYFILWTASFVIFQWVIHACVSLWWPYPFLDLSDPYAPVWVILVYIILPFARLVPGARENPRQTICCVFGRGIIAHSLFCAIYSHNKDERVLLVEIVSKFFSVYESYNGKEHASVLAKANKALNLKA